MYLFIYPLQENKAYNIDSDCVLQFTLEYVLLLEQELYTNIVIYFSTFESDYLYSDLMIQSSFNTKNMFLLLQLAEL